MKDKNTLIMDRCPDERFQIMWTDEDRNCFLKEYKEVKRKSYLRWKGLYAVFRWIFIGEYLSDKEAYEIEEQKNIERYKNLVEHFYGGKKPRRKE